MKRFAFTLESVYDYKKTVEKQCQDDLRRAREALRLLIEERARLDESFERNVKAQEETLRRGKDVLEELPKYDAFFRYIREAREALEARIVKAEEEVAKCQDLLIAAMREIKIYAKLKEEQYREYLEDVAREEAKEIDDIVSFQTTTSDEDAV